MSGTRPRRCGQACRRHRAASGPLTKMSVCHAGCVHRDHPKRGMKNRIARAAAQLLSLPPVPVTLVYDEQRYFPVGPRARTRLRARFGFIGKVILALAPAVTGQHLDRLLAAFALVARRDPAAQLYLPILDPAAPASETRRLARCQARVERSTLLRGRVHFAAKVAENDKPDLYRAADLFACPAASTPAETCALEAMASGVPTVLSARGKLEGNFAFGRHALHAEPHDVLDFGLMLSRVFRDPRLQARLARMGPHQVRSLFTAAARLARFSDGRAEPLPAGA